MAPPVLLGATLCLVAPSGGAWVSAGLGAPLLPSWAFCVEEILGRRHSHSRLWWRCYEMFWEVLMSNYLNESFKKYNNPFKKYSSISIYFNNLTNSSLWHHFWKQIRWWTKTIFCSGVVDLLSLDGWHSTLTSDNISHHCLSSIIVSSVSFP